MRWLLLAAALLSTLSPGLGGHARAQADGYEVDATGKPVDVHLIVDAGYRYPFGGQRYAPGPNDFPITYHAALSLFVGTTRGFYSGARFDGLGPRGGAFPFAATARLGYYFDVHDYVPPQRHSSTSTSTDCRIEGNWRRCETTRTRRSWTSPAHFVNGVRYVYAGYRHLGFVEGDPDPLTMRPELTQAGAIAAGVGFYGTKTTLAGLPYMTFLTEFELWYHLQGLDWDAEGRGRIGGQLRAAVVLGPAFIDLVVAFDSGFGGEISLGAGFLFAG